MHKLLFGMLAIGALFTGNSWCATPTTITVMSFNIRHCEGMDGKVDVERIAKFIRDANPDLVALQDVDRGVERTARRDIPAELARLTSMEVFFGKNIEHQGGDYGNAVLSRYVIKERSNTPLTMIGEGEQRGVLRVVVSIPISDKSARDVVFIATHLDHRESEAERIISVSELIELTKQATRLPTIVAGDFNALPNSAVHKKMQRSLKDVWEMVGSGPGLTSPADAPVERIDYVWVSHKIKPIRMQVLPTLASDHFAVISQLTIP